MLSKYGMTVEVKLTNAKIRRMSKRRQKIALAKRPTTILKNVFPISVGEISPNADKDGNHKVNVTFSYEEELKNI